MIEGIDMSCLGFHAGDEIFHGGMTGRIEPGAKYP